MSMNLGVLTPELLRQLEQALEAGEQSLMKSEVGYQTPSSGGGSLAPIVPQSLASTLANASFKMKHAALWNRIPKGVATQPVHEFTQILSHGQDGLSPFMAEGGLPAEDQTTYQKRSLQVKYVGQLRRVTDVASMTGIVGVNPNMLAEETERGTLKLIGDLERMMWHGDDTLDPLMFPGIIKQIRDNAPGNVKNLEGAAIDLDTLADTLALLEDEPNYGMPTAIYATPRDKQKLIKQAAAHGRHDQLKVGDVKFTYGRNNIEIEGSYGTVPIIAAPFLNDDKAAPPAAYGDSGSVPPTPAIGGSAVAANPASLFATADVGNYIYKVAAWGEKGFSAPVTSGTIAIAAAGEAVTLTITDPANTLVKYFRVYRTPVGRPASEAKYIGSVVNAALAVPGTDTTFVDLNAHRPNSGRLVFAEETEDVFYWAQLMNLIRRPVPFQGTAILFLLMLFGVPVVRIPSKMYVLENTGR